MKKTINVVATLLICLTFATYVQAVETNEFQGKWMCKNDRGVVDGTMNVNYFDFTCYNVMEKYTMRLTGDFITSTICEGIAIVEGKLIPFEGEYSIDNHLLDMHLEIGPLRDFHIRGTF